MADGTVDIKYLLNSEEFARESARIDASIRGTETASGSAVGKMDGDFKRLARTVGAIGIGTAFVSASREVYNFSKRYRAAMAEVSTISETINESFDSYMNRVISMTRQIPVLAPEAASALYQIVSAGHDGADGMKILGQSAKAAIAGVTETATAADGITSILNAYKKSAEDAESVSDMMFTTVRLGKTTFGELAGYIAQVTPTAAAYGVEMDQVLAAIATLTKSGVPTAQAVTRIRQAIIAASKVLGDGAFEGRSLQEALALVASKADGSESKLRALVPEVEAVNGVLGLTGINAETAADHLAEMQRSAGATAKAYGDMLENDPSQQMALLKNNILAALQALGDDALKAFSGLAETLNEAFQSGDLEKSIKTIISLVGVLAGTVIGYKTALLAAAAAQKVSLLAQQTGEYIKMARAVGMATANQIAFNRATLVNPYVALAAAIGIVVGALVVFGKEAKKTSEIIADIDGATKRFTESASEVRALTDEYDALQGKTTRTAEENDRLRVVIDKLAESVPGVVTQFDEYGRALDVNIGKVKEWSKEYRDATKWTLQGEIKTGEERLADLQKQIKGKQDIYLRGSWQRQKSKYIGGELVQLQETEEVGYSAEVRQQAAGEAQKMIAERDKLQQSLDNARSVLDEIRKAEKPNSEDGKADLKKDADNVSKRVADLRADIKKAEADIKALTAPGSKATEAEITQGRQRLKDLQAQLEVYTGVSAKGAADALGKQRELGQALTQAEIDAQTQRVAAMKEGRFKRLAEIDLEHKQTLAKIAKDKAAAKANGANAAQLGAYDKLTAAADAKRDYDRQQTEIQYARELMELYRQTGEVFLSEEEKKERAVRQRYEEERRELKKRYDGGNLGFGLSGTANYLMLSYGLNAGENKEISDLYLSGVKTMKEREAEIVAKYDKVIAAAEATGVQEKIDKAKALRDQELADLRTTQEEWYRVLFGELETYSTAAVLDAIQRARQYIDSYREQAQQSGRKLTPEEEAALAKIYKSTVSAEQAVRNKIPAGLKQTAQALREVAELAALFDDNLAGAIGSVAQIVDGFGDIQQGIGDFKKAIKESQDRKEERGDKPASFGDTLASIGAYAGAAGAVVGGVTKIIGVFKGWAQQAKLAEKEVHDFYMTAYLGAKSYEAMIRQRDYDWIDSGVGRMAVLQAQIEATEAEIGRLREADPEYKNIFDQLLGRDNINDKKIAALIEDLKNLRGELDGIGGSAATSWDATNAKLEALKKNIAAAAKDNAELLDQLRGEQYVSGEHTKRTWWTFGIGKKVVKEFSSLAGKSADEIERLYSEGKLTEEAKKLYDAWKASGDELDKWAEELEQVDAALDEMATGTSFDSFLDDFASMLAEGRTGVEDFADFTEDTIKKAILSSFKYKVLEAALRPWYDSLAEMFRQDGFPSKDEIQKWVGGLNAALPGIVEGLQGMLDDLGIDLADTAASGLRGEISEKITEETATKLEGLFRITYDKVAEIRGLNAEQLQSIRSGFGDVAAILAQQYLIAENTRRTAENTEPLADRLAEVVEELQAIKKGGGIYAK